MKEKKETEFDLYMSSLPEERQREISLFFLEFDRHTDIAGDEKTELRHDFERALIYYSNAGVQLGEALERISVSNFGGFYARPPVLWYALDDAAKIYPLSMKHGQMSVFRLSVYLKEQVVPEILQIALTFTIKRFPSFATTVKKGFFWHYLDASKCRYSVEPETDIPCRPLQIAKSGSQSFRVLYYNNRISVEYFHILTDGTGGMVFLKTLTAEYLRLLGAEIKNDMGVMDINEAPQASETANEFPRGEKIKKAGGFVDRPAVQIGGRLSKRKPCRVLHFKIDGTELKKVTSKYNATVSAYVLALLFVASKCAVDELGGNINIQVPVNMRKFYPSCTLRNFAMYCGIKIPIQDISDVSSVLGEISRQLSEKASKEAMSEMMSATNQLVRIMRYIPLAVKAPVARLVYGFLGDRVFSNTLSNLGVIKVPQEMQEYIESMDFVLGTTVTNRVSCAMVTFGNTVTLSVSKMTCDPSFEEKLNALLEEDGLFADIEGSELYED